MTRHHETRERHGRDGESSGPGDGSEPGLSGGATHRRDFLKTVGAGALVGAVGAETALAANDDVEFVETAGTELVVDGDPVYFNGTNNFWITNSHADRQRVDDVFALFEDMGIDLVRTWAHCNGQSGHCLQPSPGEHSEAALQHLDYVIAKAREHGIRLVLGLADNWDHDGGIPKYVEWVDGAENRADFYQMQETRDLYRNHVETILTRTNSITGVEYREDPTIAVWELANEPRLEQKSAPESADRGQILENWFGEMSAHIKDLDGNHLVSTGMEGFYTQSDPQGSMHGDWYGTDFVRHHQIDTIDVCSFHMYPHWWPGLEVKGFVEGDQDAYMNCEEWIAQHVTDAHETVGKPVYIGEFNVNVQASGKDLQTRNEALSRWYDVLDAHDANGALPWQIVLEETGDHDGFQIYRSESGDIIENYGETVAEKTGSGGPIADATAPATLRRGETGEFSATLSRAGGGEIQSYEWSFGDGATASGETVRHAFESTGEASVELTVTDGVGETSTDTETVSVEDFPEDTFLVEGAGETVHGSVNELHYAYTTVSGDFSVTARVADVGSTDPSAQAGIMARNALAESTALGAVAVSPSEGTELVRAYDSGTDTWRERQRDERAPPLWVRLDRSGGSVAAAVSPDGEDWTEIQTGEVDFDEEVHLGLFVSSNSPGDLCTAEFRSTPWLDEWEATDIGDVDVAGNATAGTGGSESDGPGRPADLSVTGRGESSVTVDWTAPGDTGAGIDRYEVLVDGDADQTVPADATTATVTGLDADREYLVEVAAVDVDGNRSETAAVTAALGDDGPAGDRTVAVDLSMAEISRDGTAEAAVALSEAPAGVSGYELIVEVADPSVATVSDATYPEGWLSQGTDVAADGSTATLQAVDGADLVRAGATDVELATVTLEGQSGGETTVSVTVEALDSDDGAPVPTTSVADTLMVAEMTMIEGNMPKDIDGDGRYMDLNGNDRVDSDDVVLYFNNYDDPAITDHVAAYDYNDSGEVDFDDLVTLFQEL